MVKPKWLSLFQNWLGKLIPSAIKRSTVRAVFKEAQLWKWAMYAWIGISLWDTFGGQLVPSSWSNRLPRVADLAAMIFGTIPGWLWFYVPVLIVLIASIEYFGRQIRILQNDNNRDEIIERIDVLSSQIDAVTANIQDRDLENRVEAIYECLTSSEKFKQVEKQMENLKGLQELHEYFLSDARKTIPDWSQEAFQKKLEKNYRQNNIDPVSEEAKRRTDIPIETVRSYLGEIAENLKQSSKLWRRNGNR